MNYEIMSNAIESYMILGEGLSIANEGVIEDEISRYTKQYRLQYLIDDVIEYHAYIGIVEITKAAVSSAKEVQYPVGFENAVKRCVAIETPVIREFLKEYSKLVSVVNPIEPSVDLATAKKICFDTIYPFIRRFAKEFNEAWKKVQVEMDKFSDFPEGEIANDKDAVLRMANSFKGLSDLYIKIMKVNREIYKKYSSLNPDKIDRDASKYVYEIFVRLNATDDRIEEGSNQFIFARMWYEILHNILIIK